MNRLCTVAAGLLLLGLTGCGDDVSDVGIGLIDDQAGAPETLVLDVPAVAVSPDIDVTGNTDRVLGGRVADPRFGTIAATGLLDVSSVVRTQNFLDGPLEQATLRLAPDYVYGDTLAPVTFTLRDVAEEVATVGADVETELPLGAPITTFTFAPTDTLVEVALPADWIAANDTTLRSATLDASFHGFVIEPTMDGNAVVGFDAGGSTLLAVAGGDSTVFDVDLDDTAADGKTLSVVTRLTAPDAPAGLLPVQDGAGPTAQFTLALDAEELRSAALNRAVLRVYADTLATTSDAPDFVRPLLRQLNLIGIDADGSVVLIDNATLDADGAFVFDAVAVRQVLQDLLLGSDLVERFQLAAPSNANSVDVLLLYDASDAANDPEAILTITPVNN